MSPRSQTRTPVSTRHVHLFEAAGVAQRDVLRHCCDNVLKSFVLQQGESKRERPERAKTRPARLIEQGEQVEISGECAVTKVQEQAASRLKRKRDDREPPKQSIKEMRPCGMQT